MQLSHLALPAAISSRVAFIYHQLIFPPSHWTDAGVDLMLVALPAAISYRVAFIYHLNSLTLQLTFPPSH
ncbi:hypothetical protein KFK09_004602 [Dendrobium nobile]|uniref:Uncharacterized protein n=1 Tax=Dendrobium nobile TaxID=94219 RepID=A0A8T3C4I1_DENNO|nr:hypothetical protein KFK09_004602 [Dendrobium nobile]